MSFKELDDLIHSGVKEIVLDADIVLNDGEESEYSEGIKLDVDDLVIDGNGHAIDAKGKTRIFKVTGKNITLKNIILKRGYILSDGGAIYNRGMLTVSGSTLTGNTAAWNGGAICNEEGKLVVSDSTLQGNTAEKYDGGAICNYYGTLTVSDSTLAGNTAKGDGGAIYNSLWSTLTVSDSTLKGNIAVFEGGAIHNNKDGELSVSSSTLTENRAQNGGAIYIDKDTKYESNNCTFKDNKPDDIYEGNE